MPDYNLVVVLSWNNGPPNLVRKFGNQSRSVKRPFSNAAHSDRPTDPVSNSASPLILGTFKIDFSKQFQLQGQYGEVFEYLLGKPIVGEHDAHPEMVHLAKDRERNFAPRRTKRKFSRTISTQLELTINWFDIISLNAEARGFASGRCRWHGAHFFVHGAVRLAAGLRVWPLTEKLGRRARSTLSVAYLWNMSQ